MESLDDFACETLPLCHHWKPPADNNSNDDHSLVLLSLNMVDGISQWYHLVCEILPSFPADSSPKP